MALIKNHIAASAAVIAAALGLAAGPAFGAAGDWLIRAGATTVAPDADSATISGTNGSKLDIDDNTTLGFNISYFFTDNVAVELLGALPFKHTVKGKGGDIDGVEVADIEHLPPTLSAQWHFLPNNNIRPYVGAGLTYFLVLKDDSKLGAGTDVKVDDAAGFAVQGGVDFDVAPNWFLNLDLRYVSLSTDATVSGAGAANGTYNVDVNPLVYTFAVGYKF
jgi:outer membrane protein